MLPWSKENICGTQPVENYGPEGLAHPRLGLGHEARREIAKLRKRPSTRFNNGDPSETQLPLSRKSLVNSTLLAFDEASVSPATNSGIDVGRPLIFQRPDLP